jgi:hypothetical protein
VVGPTTRLRIRANSSYSAAGHGSQLGSSRMTNSASDRTLGDRERQYLAGLLSSRESDAFELSGSFAPALTDSAPHHKRSRDSLTPPLTPVPF